MKSVRRFSASARRPRSNPASQGFVVLGVLILITGTFTAAVLIGKVVHSGRYRHEVPLGDRELRVAAAALEVRYGALTTRRVGAGEEVWVRTVGNGQVAVFADAGSTKVVGFVEEELLLPSSR